MRSKSASQTRSSKFGGFNMADNRESPANGGPFALPRAWRWETVGSCCKEVVDGDWIETKDQGGHDFRLIQISNIGVGTFVETGKYRYITRETLDRLHCREIQ